MKTIDIYHAQKHGYQTNKSTNWAILGGPSGSELSPQGLGTCSTTIADFAKVPTVSNGQVVRIPTGEGWWKIHVEIWRMTYTWFIWRNMFVDIISPLVDDIWLLTWSKKSICGSLTLTHLRISRDWGQGTLLEVTMDQKDVKMPCFWVFFW